MIAAEVKVTNNVANTTKRLKDSFAKRLGVVAERLKDRIVKSISISNQGGTAPAPANAFPHFGIGDLLKSIHALQVDDLEWHVGSFGDVAKSPDGYAHQLEFGGLIVPKKQEWLWLPYSNEAKHHKNQNRTVGEFPHTLLTVVPARSNGQWGFAASWQKGGAMVVHYTLRKRVNQSAHPFIRPAAVDPEFISQAKEIMAGTASDVTAEVTS